MRCSLIALAGMRHVSSLSRALNVELLPVNVNVRGELPVTIFEARDQDEALDVALAESTDPFGSICWPSAISLANELFDLSKFRGSLSGLKLLELGAGPGLASIVALHLGADVVATDCAPLSLRLLNVGLDAAVKSGARGTFRVDKLDITDDRAWHLASADASLVCASDMLYDCDVAAALGRAIRARLPNSPLLMTDPGRRDGRQAFLQALYDTVQSEDLPSKFDDVLLTPDEMSALRLGPKIDGAQIGVFKLGLETVFNVRRHMLDVSK